MYLHKHKNLNLPPDERLAAIESPYGCNALQLHANTHIHTPPHTRAFQGSPLISLKSSQAQRDPSQSFPSPVSSLPLPSSSSNDMSAHNCTSSPAYFTLLWFVLTCPAPCEEGWVGSCVLPQRGGETSHKREEMLISLFNQVTSVFLFFF